MGATGENTRQTGMFAMRICLIALLLSIVWTLVAELTSTETTPGTEHPTTLGLAMVGIGTLAAYAWMKRPSATEPNAATLEGGPATPVPVRYAEAAEAAAQEAALETAEHAA
jgi:hypothetical protein